MSELDVAREVTFLLAAPVTGLQGPRVRRVLDELWQRWVQLPTFRLAFWRWHRAHLRVVVRDGRGGDRAKSTGETLVTGTSIDVVVRVGEDFADAVATLLHEMAHVVVGPCGGRPHGATWHAVYAAAAGEALGASGLERRTQGALDQAVREAARAKFSIARREVA